MLRKILESANMDTRRPEIGAHFESSVPGVHVVGDLAGAPVVKLAMEQGHRLAGHLAGLERRGDVEFDVAIVGSGAAGLNCALSLLARGLRVAVFEKSSLANTIEEFPLGKVVYDEPVSRPVEGLLWLQEATREELLAKWGEAASNLDVRLGEEVLGLVRDGGILRVTTSKGQYTTARVVIATGQRGSMRKLGVPGENRANVHHRLYNPSHFHGENILVVGGGNSAIEAAAALAESGNEVTLVHRGREFHRLFAANRTKLSKFRVLRESKVTAFEEASAIVNGGHVPYNRAFVLIGADPPAAFLKQIGVRLENEWTWRRWAFLALSLAVSYFIYGVKGGDNNEFWPFTGWGHKLVSFGGRGWSFWYTVLYTTLMTVFGIQAMKRWGIDRRDKFQIWRYVSLIGFQWLFFFLIPEFLFRIAVENQWLGETLARDPNFTNNLWRSYGLIYAWPLFFYTFIGNPHQVWIYWGLLLSFGIIPVFVLLYGKRYCSWICGCGGLAETFGDRWRHLAPKGAAAIRLERMNVAVLGAAIVVTLLLVASDVYKVLAKPAQTGLEYYHLFADVWLVGILPVGLYPFLGGKVWCRYWCPLAKMMELFSAWFTRKGWSRFAITANERCIACGECTRNCQVGIDVMRFAMLQQELNNANSSCIGCGICVTVCPMGVLQFGKNQGKQIASPLVQIDV
ncbi:MAG: FAD-binding protein [Acidobacteria bacterium]|nr:FAD-binding protein [Acidobacteriota bacterium]